MILRSPLQPSIGTRSSAVPWQMQLTGAGVRDAINNPVSFGVTLGPELVTNGDFSNGTTGWAGWNANVTIAVASGQMTVTQPVGGNQVGVGNSSAITTISGRRYRVTLDVISYTNSGLAPQIRVGDFNGSVNTTSGTLAAGTGTRTFDFTANFTATYVNVATSSNAGNTITFDNISVREVATGYLLPGLGGARLNASARTSVALQQKADGTYEYAAHNLLTYSEEFDNAAWLSLNGSVTANSTAAPFGPSTSDLFVENTANGRHMVYRTISTVSGASCTETVYAKANTRRYLTVALKNVAGSSPRFSATFDLIGGAVVTTDSAGSPTGTAALIQSIGSGYYRIGVTMQAASGSTNVEIGLSDSATPAYAESIPTYLGNGSGSVWLWGAQLNLGPTALPYVPTTTAAVYAPAVDWLSAQSAYGLRSEAAATNLLTWSTAFDDAAWTKTGSPITTVTPNTTIAPDGTLTADTITFGGSLGSDRIHQDTATAAANGTAVAGSVWLWAAAPTTVSLYVERTGPFDSEVTVCNLTTTPTRFTMLHSATWTGTTVLRLRLADKAGGGSIFAWGAQLETGTRASSPILTFATTATRAADLLIVPDTGAGLVGQAQGTIAVSAVAGIVGNLGVVSINDGSAADRVDIRSDGTTTVTLASTALSSPTVATMVAGTLAKTSMSYSLRAAAASRAGSLPVPVGDAPGFTQLQIGGIDGGTTANLDGWITSLQIAQTSSLPASLQGMTA